MGRLPRCWSESLRRRWRRAWSCGLAPRSGAGMAGRRRPAVGCALRGEALEPRTLLAADVVISEILASNDNDIRDEDRLGRPDWIEVLNAGDEAVNLEGWSLTDDRQALGKWRFPDLPLAPNERVVVFASGKDRAVAGSELHTNFGLGRGGEYLALVEPDGMTVAYALDEYPAQIRDVSYGMVQGIVESDLVLLGDTGRYLIPTSGDLGLNWTEVGFEDDSWAEGATGLGYSFRTEYDELTGTNVKGVMKGVNASVYLRLPFVVEDRSALFSLTLSMRYKDGYAAYLNGTEVARVNAPEGPLSWNSTASSQRGRDDALIPEEIDLTPYLELLKTGDNVLSIHGLNSNKGNSRFLIAPELRAGAVGPLEPDTLHYFPYPTAGRPNGLGWTTAVTSVSHSPSVLAAGEPLTVRAVVESTVGPVSEVLLYYRVMFEAEQALVMHDDGLHGDGAAGDAVYGAMIPADVALPGELVRYRITTADGLGSVGRSPAFQDPLDTSEYWGTIVADPAIQSNLPVMHLFLIDPMNVDTHEGPPTGADTDEGTRGALYYQGELYDNIHIDVHGFTTRGFPKRSHDAFMPRDHKFLIEDGLPRLDDINLITN